MTDQCYLLLQPGGGESLRFLDDSRLILKGGGGAPGGSTVFYEYVAAPAAKGSPQHIHQGHEETFYVVEGEFEFALGEATFSAGPGSFLLVKRGQPHGFRNCGKSPGRIIGTFGAQFAQYFRELAEIISRTGAAPTSDEWTKLYGRYDTTFYRAPKR